MQDTIKIGTAALGGYVLGRTKKAKAAIGLALWLSGRGRPRDIAREQVAKALQSDRGQELLSQLRGPVLSAGRQAAVSVFESQAGRLSDALQQRTELVGATAEGTGRRARGAARTGSDTVSKLTERRRGGSGRREQESPGGRARRGRRDEEGDEGARDRADDVDEEDEYADVAGEAGADEDEEEEEEAEYEDEYAEDEESDEADEGDEEEEDEEEPEYEDEYQDEEDEDELEDEDDEAEDEGEADDGAEDEGADPQRGRRRGRRRSRQPV